MHKTVTGLLLLDLTLKALGKYLNKSNNAEAYPPYTPGNTDEENLALYGKSYPYFSEDFAKNVLGKSGGLKEGLEPLTRLVSDSQNAFDKLSETFKNSPFSFIFQFFQCLFGSNEDRAESLTRSDGTPGTLKDIEMLAKWFQNNFFLAQMAQIVILPIAASNFGPVPFNPYKCLTGPFDPEEQETYVELMDMLTGKIPPIDDMVAESAPATKESIHGSVVNVRGRQIYTDLYGTVHVATAGGLNTGNIVVLGEYAGVIRTPFLYASRELATTELEKIALTRGQINNIFQLTLRIWALNQEENLSTCTAVEQALIKKANWNFLLLLKNPTFPAPNIIDQFYPVAKKLAALPTIEAYVSDVEVKYGAEPSEGEVIEDRSLEK